MFVKLNVINIKCPNLKSKIEHKELFELGPVL